MPSSHRVSLMSRNCMQLITLHNSAYLKRPEAIIVMQGQRSRQYGYRVHVMQTSCGNCFVHLFMTCFDINTHFYQFLSADICLGQVCWGGHITGLQQKLHIQNGTLATASLPCVGRWAEDLGPPLVQFGR